MDGDEVRIDQLERRIRRLEARLRRVEAGQGISAEAPDVESSRFAEPPAVARPPVLPLPAALRATPPPPPSGARPLRPEPAQPRWGPSPSAATTPARPERAAATPAPTDEDSWTRVQWEPAPPGPSISLRDLEERFAGRALAWVGGFALVAAAIFFLSLAFSRGWINEPLRVLIGLVAGSAAFTAGGVFLDRRNALMGNVLTAVGLGIVSISLFAATRLYHLVPPEIGLLGALVAAIAAAAIAIRFDAREVAAFGLIAALIAPPVVGASPTLLTLAFVAVTLVGTTAIALFRSWRWLPSIAFVLAAPQLASWLVGNPDTTQALVALAGFWVVNIVAAAGEEVRIRRDDLRPSSATLLLATATFLLWGGFVVLAGDLEPWRGTFLAMASVAHLLVGAWFLRRQGLEHLFGNLVAGTGVAILTIAAFVQLGAPAVPLAWAMEAVALAWLAVRRRHRWSAAAALVLGGLTVAHLLVLEYPLDQGGIPADVAFATPFLHPEAASLGAVLLALAVAIVLVPIRWIRSALAGVGVLLAAHAVTFEVSGAQLAAALSSLAVAGLVLDRVMERFPDDQALQPVTGWVRERWLSSTASLLAGMMAIALIFTTEYPPDRLGTLYPLAFRHPEAASLAFVLLGLAAAGALVGVRWIRSALAGTAILLVAWALGFEVTWMSLIAMLVVLLPVGVIADRILGRWSDDPRFAGIGGATPFALGATAAGIVAWLCGLAYAYDNLLPVTRWGSITPPDIPFSDQRALAAALIAAAALAGARWTSAPLLRRMGVIATIVAVAWVVPFEVFADGVVVLWVALAVIAVLAIRVLPDAMTSLTRLGGVLVGGAALVAFSIVATPVRLVVVDPAEIPRAALLAGWPLAFIALALAVYAAPRHGPFAPWRTWFEVAAGAIAVYLVSVAVVDVFQRMVGGSIAVEELAKQAQVALSVCWTAIGAAALVVGLSRRLPMLRHAGFGLLGLATAKVFVIDLAAMDVAYRALVLAGLGLLLLLSAWLFTHFRGPRSGASGLHGGARPAG